VLHVLQNVSDPLLSMKGHDPEGQVGPKQPLPDSVQIFEPPVDKIVSEPSSESREPAVVSAAPPAAEEPVYAQEPAYQADSFPEEPAF
jgi:small subunit ribosomal protein S3e